MSALPRTAGYAERYCEMGLSVTWTPPGQKGPRHTGWNDPAHAIRDRKDARRHWTRNPQHGIACLLAPSGLVSLDIDDEPKSTDVLRRFGVELRASSPCIVGRHFRLMFRAPAEPLKHRTLAWPKKDDLRGGEVLFEFRAGCVSDTLPPTIHPGTGQAYRWENPPRNGFPALPDALLALWRDWDQFNRQALALCPWYVPPKPRPAQRARTAESGESVIDAFNAAHEAASILEAHGYVRQGRRFASPESTHAPGIVILDSGKVFAHHAGDPLHADHALDAFDLFRILEHRGDFRAAVRAAAEALGLRRSAA